MEEFQTMYSFFKSKTDRKKNGDSEREQIEEKTDCNKQKSKDQSQIERIWFDKLELMYTQELKYVIIILRWASWLPKPYTCPDALQAPALFQLVVLSHPQQKLQHHMEYPLEWSPSWTYQLQRCTQ